MTLAELIESYSEKLPKRFFVKFALYCAKDVNVSNPKPEALKAIEVIELWLEGKATEQECRDASYAAYAAANATYPDADAAYAAAAAHAASAATYTDADAAHAASAATYAADTAANASTKTLKREQYKQHFLNMINDLSEFEKELL